MTMYPAAHMVCARAGIETAENYVPLAEGVEVGKGHAAQDRPCKMHAQSHARKRAKEDCPHMRKWFVPGTVFHSQSQSFFQDVRTILRTQLYMAMFFARAQKVFAG